MVGDGFRNDRDGRDDGGALDDRAHVSCDLCDAIGHHPGSGCGCGAPELERVDTVFRMCPECADEDARLRALGPLDARKAAAR